MRKKVLSNKNKKNFIWNMIGSTLYAFNSLFFLIIVTRINGIEIAGIFTFAFSTALMLSYIGIYSGRIYQVSDDSKATDLDFIVSKLVTCSFMMIGCILFIVLHDYSLNKILILMLMFVYKMLDAFFDCIYGVFQKYDDLYKVGISQTLKSIISIILFILVDYFSNDIILSILVLIIVNTSIFIIYDIGNIKKLIKNSIKIKFDNVKKILFDGFFPFLFSFLILYLVNASKYVIDSNFPDSLQTIYGIILMPGTIMQLMVAYIIQPYITKIKYCYINKEYNGINKYIKNFSLVTLGLCLIIIMVAYLIGIPVLSWVYGINLNLYKENFMLLLYGSTAYAIVTIISSVFITMHKNKIQVLFFGMISIITFFSARYFVIKYAVFGACVTYSLSMFLLLVVFYVYKLLTINMNIKKRQ